ncbi:MAG: diguanylate cyclase response regulator [Rhodobacterales bacterium]|nr:MAG: diguanylate cyclase response regulator [Rhodobacterales bacterium]
MAGKILIADDVATNRIVMKVTLGEACYQVLQASGGQETLAKARQDDPDLILLDLKMPDIDGLEVCRALKNDPATAHIPIIIVTAHKNDRAKIEALRVGADDFMTRPLDELTLLARVRSLLRARSTDEELRLRESTSRDLGFAETAAEFLKPVTIGIIAAENKTAVAWKNAVAGKLDSDILVISKDKALAKMPKGQSPDVFIITCDLAKPGDGLRLLSELRSRADTRHSAIIMVVPKDAFDKSASALDLGANDLMFDDFSADELRLRLKTQIRRKQQADRLRKTVRDGLRMAVIDPLTGLYNRRYALPHLARISERSKTTKRPFAVMVLDLDHFKNINDTYGHSAGDMVLAEVAERLKDNLRAVDMVARIGGEEFLVVMPDTQLAQARITAERLCRVVNQTKVVQDKAKPNIAVSLSIGVAMGGLPDQAQTANQLIDAADKALYTAKLEGRNQVTFSQPAL